MVKHFNINLNKAANRLDIYEQKRKKKKIFMLGVYWVAVVVILGAGYYFSSITNKQLDIKKSTIAEIDRQVLALETSESYISKEDVYALADLSSKRADWAKMLMMLAHALPPDIAITELDFHSGLLVVKGISKIKLNQKDLDRVMSIINSIQSRGEAKEVFAGMKFKMSNRIKHQDQEILNFEISCPIS